MKLNNKEIEELILGLELRMQLVQQYVDSIPYPFSADKRDYLKLMVLLHEKLVKEVKRDQTEKD